MQGYEFLGGCQGSSGLLKAYSFSLHALLERDFIFTIVRRKQELRNLVPEFFPVKICWENKKSKEAAKNMLLPDLGPKIELPTDSLSKNKFVKQLKCSTLVLGNPPSAQKKFLLHIL